MADSGAIEALQAEVKSGFDQVRGEFQHIEAQIGGVKQDLDQVRKVLYGNGDPQKSVVARLAVLDAKLATLETQGRNQRIMMYTMAAAVLTTVGNIVAGLWG